VTELRRTSVSDAVDAAFLTALLALLALGVVMMTSASVELAADRYGNPFHHLFRHGVYLVIGLVALALTVQIPLRLWEELGVPLLVLGAALLVLVLVPGVGITRNGATRWLGIGGLTLQASEVAKFCLLVYFAGYASRKEQELGTKLTGLLPAVGILALYLLLLLLEPDFGAAVVLATAALGMLFLAGARFLPFLLLALTGAGAAVALALSSPYRMQRLVTYLDPWANQFDGGYQLTQSLIAFGRGQWFGVGLGNSLQKLFYLPEAHTDFVFAIVAEELGLLGALGTLGLFALLIWRIFHIAGRAAARRQKFAATLTGGIALLFAAQVFINVGVNTGLLPTKGLTLPFLSYGGSSLVVSCALMGLVLRVDRELRDRGARQRAGGVA
jgi:cell division protein FtsW